MNLVRRPLLLLQYSLLFVLFLSAALLVYAAEPKYTITRHSTRPEICRQEKDKEPVCRRDFDITKSKNGIPQACFDENGNKKCLEVADYCKQYPQNEKCARAMETGVYKNFKKCPEALKEAGCSDGEAKSVSCGGRTVTIPYLFFNVGQTGRTPQVGVQCGAREAKVTLTGADGRVVAERATCNTAYLSGGASMQFYFQALSREEHVRRRVAEAKAKGATQEQQKAVGEAAQTETPGTWRIVCAPDDASDNAADGPLNPNNATRAQSPEDLAKQAQRDSDRQFYHDVDSRRRVVAQCDDEGNCRYQTFVKNEQGEWVPRSNPVTVEKDKLDDELKKINSAEAFDRVAQAHPYRPPSANDDDDKKKAAVVTQPPPGNQTPGPSSSGNGFRPTSSSSNPKSQQSPQQQPQNQQQPSQQQPGINMPAPYCAGISANKQQITEGEQVTIQWNIPYAIRYELRGGSGNINGSSVTVRPKETTAYSVVGYGIPGAGQNTGYGQYGTTYGQSDTGQYLDSSFGAQQYGYQQYNPYQTPQLQQQSCGIPGAACCGPITITVQPKKAITRDVVVDDEEEEEDEERYEDTSPEIRCSPKDVEDGKSATIVWSCPDESRRATSLAKHLNGTPLAEAESFYVEGKTSGSVKVYPQTSTIYAVRCISTKGKRSGTSSCTVRVNPRPVLQRSAPTRRVPSTVANTGAEMKLSIVAEPQKISVGNQEVTISWRTANVDSCSVVGPNGFKQDTTEGKVSGTSDKPGPLTFTLTCKKGSDTRTRSVRVDVQ